MAEPKKKPERKPRAKKVEKVEVDNKEVKESEEIGKEKIEEVVEDAKEAVEESLKNVETTVEEKIVEELPKEKLEKKEIKNKPPVPKIKPGDEMAVVKNISNFNLEIPNANGPYKFLRDCCIPVKSIPLWVKRSATYKEHIKNKLLVLDKITIKKR